EGRRHEAGSVVHEALCAKLPHARIDQRVPGEPVLPRVEPLEVFAPAVASWTHVLARDLGARRKELVVEVAPAELTHELVASRTTDRALHDLGGRDAPEAQVRREARRRVVGEIVPPAAV